MAKLDQRPEINTKIVLELSEEEARALFALTEYGTKPFLKMFYEHLGKAALEDHEAGLVALFESVKTIMPGIFTRMKAARGVFIKGN